MQWNRSILGSVWMAICFCTALAAQGLPSGTVGWYNGDWRPLIPSYNNWYASSQQFARTYDDFIVPAGGWVINGVFAHVDMPPLPVTQAVWEIRSGVSTGNGCVVASGTGSVTLTQGPAIGDGKYVYLLVLGGLSVSLPPGKYWLSLTPVTSNTQVYICATLGVNAIGNPPGNDGQSFYYSSSGTVFSPIQSTGSGGTSGDFSYGVLLAPFPATNPLSCQVTPPMDRNSAWPADLTTLAQQMVLDHSAPFPGVSVTDFTAEANDLSTRIAGLSDAQVRTDLQALVASIGDPHTDVEWPYSTFQYLPLTFYWFDDGIYIIAAPQQYSDLLGGQLISIGNARTETAISRMTQLVAHDNESWLKYVLPGRLTNTDFLYGTGITESNTAAEIWVQSRSTAQGNSPQSDTGAIERPVGPPRGRLAVNVGAVAQAQYPPLLPVFQGTPPLYQQHPDKYYWSAVIDGGATVYFQYNSCTEDPNEPSATFLAQLNQTLAQPGVERLVVDMRNNTGGSAGILDPWISTIQASRFNQQGRLYVIVGKATFSAAMEATDLFHDNTAAIFVGEPTGGKPQFLLRRGDFPLPYYNISVSYSNGVEGAKLPGPTLVPDIQVPVTFQDYMNGIDRALDAILSIPPPHD